MLDKSMSQIPIDSIALSIVDEAVDRCRSNPGAEACLIAGDISRDKVTDLLTDKAGLIAVLADVDLTSLDYS
jgi:hypothetical protein